MLLAINRQIALALGEYPRPARRRLTQKHQSCQRRNCLNWRGHPKHSVRIFTHRRTSDTVWLSRDPLFCGPLSALLVPTTTRIRRLSNGMIECMGGRDQRQSENLWRSRAVPLFSLR